MKVKSIKNGRPVRVRVVRRPFGVQVKRLLTATIILSALSPNAKAEDVAVVTRSYDNARTGAITTETILTPAAIAGHGLVKRASLTLQDDDPRIEAQPLFVPGVMLPDGKKHNVLFAFSMSNRVWAFDADTFEQVWAQPAFLGPPFKAAPGDPVDSKGINKTFGILSTPVIDLESGLIYAVNWTLDSHGDRLLHLNAIKLTDGTQPADRPPLGMSAAVVNQSGKTIRLSQVQKQRAALLLCPLRGPATPPARKMLYVAFTGSEEPPADLDPSKVNHGWLIGFDVDAWKQTAAWVSTPSSFGGGIWQASQGPAADQHGNVYLMTANGGYLVKPDGMVNDFNGTTDFGECFVKLSPSLQVVDWFSPFSDWKRKDWKSADVAPFSGYEYGDQDLGSGGPVLIPDSSLVLGSGKDGVLYVLDRNKMGKAVADFTKLVVPPSWFTFDPPSFPAYAGASPTGNLDFKPSRGVKTRHLHGTPVYWKSEKHGRMLFVWGENSTLRAFALADSGKTTLLAQGQEVASAALASIDNQSLGGMPGAMLALSANGDRNGIVWATAPVDQDANKAPVPGVVRAYDASEFATQSNPAQLRKLWEQDGFTFSKFCTPLVVSGKVFVPTYDGRIDVYSLQAPN